MPAMLGRRFLDDGVRVAAGRNSNGVIRSGTDMCRRQMPTFRVDGKPLASVATTGMRRRRRTRRPMPRCLGRSGARHSPAAARAKMLPISNSGCCTGRPIRHSPNRAGTGPERRRRRRPGRPPSSGRAVAQAPSATKTALTARDVGVVDGELARRQPRAAVDAEVQVAASKKMSCALYSLRAMPTPGLHMDPASTLPRANAGATSGGLRWTNLSLLRSSRA